MHSKTTPNCFRESGIHRRRRGVRPGDCSRGSAGWSVPVGTFCTPKTGRPDGAHPNRSAGPIPSLYVVFQNRSVRNTRQAIDGSQHDRCNVSVDPVWTASTRIHCFQISARWRRHEICNATSALHCVARCESRLDRQSIAAQPGQARFVIFSGKKRGPILIDGSCKCRLEYKASIGVDLSGRATAKMFARLGLGQVQISGRGARC